MLVLSAHGAEVTLEQARTAVANWSKLSPHPLDSRLGQTVRSARTYSAKDGSALFHVVRFQEGGYAVAAADDGILPIIAFSDDDDLVADERNPLWVMLNRDLPQRLALSRLAARRQLAARESAEVGEHAARWNRLLSSASSGGYSTLDASVSDLRVSPLLSTLWDQLTAYGGACYNYYVPPYAEGSSANDPCGCVATAGAQLMRFHQYPAASVTPGTYTIWVDGVASNATMKGGVYAWTNMPPVPASSSTTLAQRQEIGKLTYDVGVASYMAYAAGGSGAFDPNLVDALKSRFGYASAYIIMDQNAGVIGALTNAALSNLDAKYPVIFGISGSSGGHEVVADGYGYTGGKLYLHLNMGWSGSYNAWYNLPTFSAYVSFDTLGSIVYNVFPTSTVEVVSGRVRDLAGAPVSGATVVATNQSTSAGIPAVLSDAKGIYAFFVPVPSGHGPQGASATYTITASLAGRKATASATVKANSSTTYSYTASTGAMSYTPGSGTVGNSGGNQLTLPDPVPPAPAGVSASDGASTAAVSVSWVSATNATGYKVYRYTTSASNSASVVGSVATTNFTDASAAPGALYYYWVKATNATGTSAFSAYDTGYSALSAPTNVAASDSSTSAIVVTWSAVTGASYYRVYRAATAEGAKSALGAWQAALTYSDATTAYSETNCYWVAAAVDAAGTRASAFSNYDTGVRLAPVTSTTPVPVPYAWLDTYGLVSGGDYEAAASADADGDGFPAWQEYVAGTVPTNGASTFLARIGVSNGVLLVTWSPDMGTARVYSVDGKSSLTNAAWLSPTNSATRFFRVRVGVE